MTRRTHTIHAPSTIGTSATFATDRTASATGTMMPRTIATRQILGYRRSKRAARELTERWKPSWSARAATIWVRR